MSFAFSSLAISDVGLVRTGNEDAGFVSHSLIAVADGMGGHAAGEIASKIAVTTLAGLSPVISDSTIDADSRTDILLSVAYEIDNQILKESDLHPEYAGMGTTLTALNLVNTSVELLHIGDSRCYHYSQGKLTQISYDHTVMQELLDQGRLTPEEVRGHPQRSMLTQVLMGDSGIDPVLVVYPVALGDKFLLCSDGLTGVLSDHEILSLIKSESSETLLSALVDATKKQGAPDNVTIIWAEVVESEPPSSSYFIGAARE